MTLIGTAGFRLSVPAPASLRLSLETKVVNTRAIHPRSFSRQYRFSSASMTASTREGCIMRRSA
jgi:hypothetical protein